MLSETLINMIVAQMIIAVPIWIWLILNGIRLKRIERNIVNG